MLGLLAIALAAAAPELSLRVEAPAPAKARESFPITVVLSNASATPLVVLPRALSLRFEPSAGARYTPYPGPRLDPNEGARVVPPKGTLRLALDLRALGGDGVWALDPGGYAMIVAYAVLGGASPIAGKALFVGKIEGPPVRLTVR